jgi:hypothetical protein
MTQRYQADPALKDAILRHEAARALAGPGPDPFKDGPVRMGTVTIGSNYMLQQQHAARVTQRFMELITELGIKTDGEMIQCTAEEAEMVAKVWRQAHDES